MNLLRGTSLHERIEGCYDPAGRSTADKMSATTITVGVPAKHRASLQEFIETERLPWTLVDAPAGRVNLVEKDPPAECDLEHLFPGGRIPCSVAFQLAETCGTPPASIGRLMNLLKIKIYDCQLGCFQ